MRIRNFSIILILTLLITVISAYAYKPEIQEGNDSAALPDSTEVPTITPSPTNTVVPADVLTQVPTFDETVLAEEIFMEVTKTLEAYWIKQTPSVTPTLPDADLRTGMTMVNHADGEELIFIQTDMKKESRGFWLYRNEISNADYHKCMEEGMCTGPISSRCAEEKNYFHKKSFRDHPVINITQKQAEAYCSWAGMELMSAGDWQAAAEIFSDDHGNYGRRENLPVKNSSDETQLFGNVWEWTSDNADRVNAIIAGGSWKTSDADIHGRRLGKMKANQCADDVGFRCVRYVY